MPDAIVMLEELPLTANGKVDKKALPEPEVAGRGEEESYRGARTEIEELMAGIWRQALGVERVAVNDNFFELGGHSLLATQVVSRIREVFKVEVECAAQSDLRGEDARRFEPESGGGAESGNRVRDTADRESVESGEAAAVICAAAAVVHRSVGAWKRGVQYSVRFALGRRTGCQGGC